MDALDPLMGHTISAGGGAALTLIIDKVVRIFTEREKRAAEIALAERLQAIEGKLDQAISTLAKNDDMAERVAWLEANAGRQRRGHK
jgi:hypothetical protein